MGSGGRRPGPRGRLAVLDEYRTRRAPTGAALRQRAILAALAPGGEPAGRTRTGVARRAAPGGRAKWKNVYTAVMQDIDGALVPLGLVEEAGRMPPRRGPSALREHGIPYYHLTRPGMLVAAAFAPDADVAARLAQLFAGSAGEEARVGRALGALAGAAPGLARAVLEGHVREFCEGRQRRLLPLTADKLAVGAGGEVRASAGFLAGVMGLGEEDRGRVGALLGAISGAR